MNIIRLHFSLILILLSYNLLADSQIWEIEGVKIVSKFDKDEVAFMSAECPQNGCFWDNIKKEKLLSKIKLGNLSGGKNPGTDICKQIAHSRVVIGRNTDNQFQSFCMFEDKTFISSMAVYGEWLKQNK